jgi:hypothetical protein
MESERLLAEPENLSSSLVQITRSDQVIHAGTRKIPRVQGKESIGPEPTGIILCINLSPKIFRANAAERAGKSLV